MAKRNRTASTPRRATAAKATILPADLAADILGRTEEACRREQYNLHHAASLLLMLGQQIGEPSANWRGDSLCELGLRAEYIAAQILEHTRELGRKLDAVNMVAGRLVRRPVPSVAVAQKGGAA
jgi:hypothetical protein